MDRAQASANVVLTSVLPWPLVIVVFGVTLTDSAAAGLAAGAMLGMLTNLDLVLIVRYVQRWPSTERLVLSAIGMVAGLAVLWGGSNWAAGNLFSRVTDPGDFSTHYWLSAFVVSALGLIWAALQLVIWNGEP